MRGVRLALAGAALAGAGCSGEALPAARVSIGTLETGVIVVSNPAVGAWGARPAWRLTAEAKIGTRYGAEHEEFGDVRGLALDAEGRVYVFDVHVDEIRVFDSRGGYVRSIGRRGSGPGELRFALGGRFDRAERLWVLNQSNLRYSVFDTSGALLAEYPRRGNVGWGEWHHGVFTPSGELYDWQPFRVGPERRMFYGRYDPGRGAFVDSIAGPSLPPDTPLGWGHILPTATGWWVGVASEYRLWQLTRSRDTVRIVHRAHELNPLRPEQRDSARQVLRDVSQRARQDLDWDIPRQRIFDWFVVDDRGYVWVALTSDSAAHETGFDVFDPQGVYLGVVLAPYRVERTPRPVVRGNRIAFVTKDELDVAYIVAFRIEGRRR